MTTAETTEIRIEAGTIVLHHRNIRRERRIAVEPVKLLGTVFVNAVRDQEGLWRYTCGREAYSCAGGLGIPTR